MQNDSIDNLRLDLNRERVRGVIYVRAGDTRARTIHLTLVNNGTVVDLSEAVFCGLLIKKPDLNENDQAMVRVGNELQYTFRTQDINVPGECKCMVQVTFADGTIVTGPEFAVMVFDQVINQNHERSMNEYTAITQQLVDATAQADRAEDEADRAADIKSDCADLKQDCEDIKNSLPTVYDAVLTIQQNGVTVDTFTANASSNVTANIIVPTKTSDLSNDSNFAVDASYVHTDNNYTTTEQTKLASIAAGAEINVQSDWNQSDNTADDYIKNKPNIPDVSDYYDKTEVDTLLGGKVDAVAGKGLSTEDYTTAEQTKLASIAAGAEVNVQSDWNQSDNTADDFIKNKPNLATVATSGSYTDLSNKPTIPDAQIQSDWSQSDNTKKDYIKSKPSLAAVATSGSYNDLSNKPTIPAAQIQSDWNQSDNTKLDYIKNKPDISGVAALTGRVSALESAVADILAVLGYPYDPEEEEE